MWTGNIEEATATDGENAPKWIFHLYGDQLDAAELDRWVGPRARPGWLQRLLPSLLGGSAPSPPASELVRRVNAEGELDVGQLTIEKLKLEQVHAKGSLRDLHLEVQDADAEWAGGKVRAKIGAKFLPRPAYDISAEFERVNLSQLPGTGRIAERLTGTAAGTLHLKTEGVGREELLGKLEGRGDFHLKRVGTSRMGRQRQRRGRRGACGNFALDRGKRLVPLKDHSIFLDDLKLDGGKELDAGQWNPELWAERGFGHRNGQCAERARTASRLTFGNGRVLKISGPLDGPKVSVEKPGVRQPAD